MSLQMQQWTTLWFFHWKKDLESAAALSLDTPTPLITRFGKIMLHVSSVEPAKITLP
jgi:hypothetical protein